MSTHASQALLNALWIHRRATFLASRVRRSSYLHLFHARESEAFIHFFIAILAIIFLNLSASAFPSFSIAI
jgi:hypothetical protein